LDFETSELIQCQKETQKALLLKACWLVYTVYKTVYTCITPSKQAKPKSMLYIPPGKEITRQPQIQARKSVYHQPPPTPTWLLFHHVLAHNPEVTKKLPKKRWDMYTESGYVNPPGNKKLQCHLFIHLSYI
jgi:hypothetical protein